MEECLLKVEALAFQCSIPAGVERVGGLIRSFELLEPTGPSGSRTSSAMKKKRFATCSTAPRTLAKRYRILVATPTGQVLRWHLHHDAAFDHQRTRWQSRTRRRRSADRARRDGLDLAIDLQADAVAQTVQHQGLLGSARPSSTANRRA